MTTDDRGAEPGDDLLHSYYKLTVVTGLLVAITFLLILAPIPAVINLLRLRRINSEGTRPTGWWFRISVVVNVCGLLAPVVAVAFLRGFDVGNLAT